MAVAGVRLRALCLLTAGFAAVAVGSAAPAGAHPAAHDICVGVVVDTTQLGGAVETDCATVPDGSDGVDVLDAAGHTLTVCRDGIIGEIDGQPADGCTTKDSSHYWSYWHRAADSTAWTYATEGPATYQPGNKSTEGWVFQNGHTESDNQPPPDRAYRRICPPSPDTRSGSPSPPATVGTNYKPPGAPTTPPPPPTATAVPATTAAPAPAPVKRTHRHRVRPAATATPTPTSSATTTPSPAATHVVDALPAHNSSGGPPVGLIVGIAAAVALGGATAWQVRRQRNRP